MGSTHTFIFCLMLKTLVLLGSSALGATFSFLTITCFTPGRSSSFMRVDLYASTLPQETPGQDGCLTGSSHRAAPLPR